MTQGELYKKLSPMFDGYFDDRYEFADVLKVLDEAKANYPTIKQAVEKYGAKKENDEYISYSEVPTIVILLNNEREKWFAKWFGDAKP